MLELIFLSAIHSIHCLQSKKVKVFFFFPNLTKDLAYFVLEDLFFS